jgi:hypothetical protein
MATTLTVDQKRAIGDFVLFVARRGLSVLVKDIETSIDDKLGVLLELTPGTLRSAAHQALYKPIALRIQAIWNKYLQREFYQMVHCVDGIKDPGSLGRYLHQLSSAVMKHEYNVVPDWTLMREFIELIQMIEGQFQIVLSADSHKILAFLEVITSEQHINKISSFFDLGCHMGRMNADMVSHSVRSIWCTKPVPLDPRLRAIQDEGEWEEVRQIMNLCVDMPLHDVIVLAVNDIAEYYPPNRKRNCYGYGSGDAHVENHSTREFFYALCFHPIFNEFWTRVFGMYELDILRGEINALIESNSRNDMLKELFNVFLAFYSDRHRPI